MPLVNACLVEALYYWDRWHGGEVGMWIETFNGIFVEDISLL